MKTVRLHPIAEDYLARLDRAARGLPRPERMELLRELRTHLETGLPPESSDAEALAMVGDLGAPEDIVTAAGGTPHGRPPSTWGVIEILAVLGLTVGTVLMPVVLPLAGLCLAWVSDQWTRGEKLVATALTVLPAVVLTALVASFLLVASVETVPLQGDPMVVEGGWR